MTLLSIFVFAGQGHTASRLERLSRPLSGGSTQLLAFFDHTPDFSHHLAGKRLDITLPETSFDSALALPPADQNIVRTLLSRVQDRTIITLYFRFPPQDLKVTAQSPGTLIIDLVPGNQFTAVFKELSAALGGVSEVEGGAETRVNPLSFSPYSSNWASFFHAYEPLPTARPAPSFYLPPFPLARILSGGPPGESDEFDRIIEQLNQRDWHFSLTRVQELLQEIENVDIRKLLALTHAEILFRLGSTETARRQFRLFEQTYRGEDAAALARYALALIDALENDSYQARIELDRLAAGLPADHPLAGILNLSLAEAELATYRYPSMGQSLGRAKGLSGPADIQRQLRSADLLFASGADDEALALYRSLGPPSQPAGRSYSINGYCSLLFRARTFSDSLLCFDHLASHADSDENTALALYLAALSALHSGNQATARARFEEIGARYPGTEGAIRAELKRFDLCLLDGPECWDPALEAYGRLADTARFRSVALEAAFKEALVHHLAGDDESCVVLLMKLLREHRSGEIRDHGQALLIQLLPGVIRQHLSDGRDFEAITLARKNRDYFEYGWLDTALLEDLGGAFERLSLHREALHLYLYLGTLQKNKVGEDIYLAMARAAGAAGDEALVEDVASQYLDDYPLGSRRLDIGYYRIASLRAAGRIDRASTLLPEPLPDDDRYRDIAAAIRYHLENYPLVVELLHQPYLEGIALHPEQLHMLAESLMKTGRQEEARGCFRQLASIEEYRDRSRYRLAQIEGSLDAYDGSRPSIEADDGGGEESRWDKLAALELRFQRLLTGNSGNPVR